MAFEEVPESQKKWGRMPIMKALKEEMEEERRQDFMQDYYAFSGQVINRPYQECLDPLFDMFDFFVSMMKDFEYSEDQIILMKDTVKKWDKFGFGIRFNDLLKLFREISDSNVLTNTFSTAEISRLVAQFNEKDGEKGYISPEAFMDAWLASCKRTIVAQKTPRPILSAGFVSEAYQQVNLLPTGFDHYYLPMDFADGPEIPISEAVEEGWYDKNKIDRKIIGTARRFVKREGRACRSLNQAHFTPEFEVVIQKRVIDEKKTRNNEMEGVDWKISTSVRV